MGCGKGFVAEYLKQDGFQNIVGMDCSKNILKISEMGNNYGSLERCVLGQKDTVLLEKHIG